MNHYRAKLCVFLAWSGVLATTLAQAANIEPPKVQLIDKFGVNVANGQVSQSIQTVSIGGERGLAHSVTVHANEFDFIGYNGFNDKFVGRARNVRLSESASYTPRNVLRVFDWADTVDFAYVVNGVIQQDGSTLASGYTFRSLGDERHTLEVNGNGLDWIKPDGTLVRIFRGSDPVASSGGTVSELIYPNGFTIKVWSGGMSVNTNTGFQLKRFFVPDNRPLDKPDNPNLVNAGRANSAEWSQINPKYIRGINSAIEYCPPTTSDCALTRSWPTATFDWPGGMPRTMFIGESLVSVTDAQGAVTRLRFNAYDLAYNGTSVVPPYVPGREFAPRLVGLTPGISTQEQFTYDYKNIFGSDLTGTFDVRLNRSGLITRSTNLTLNAQYFMGQAFMGGDSINDGPALGGITRVHLKASVQGNPGALYFATTEDGTLYFENSPRNWKTQFLRSGAPQEDYEYTRGNLTKVFYAKATGNEIFVQAGFPASCTAATRKTCNQADWVRDARGNVTTYTYHAESGQVASVTSPANKRGIAPQVRYEYGQRSAHYYDSDGTRITGSPIWLLTAERYCVNSSASSGVCAGNDEVITRYEYEHDNLLMTGTTVTDQVTGITLRTCYRYDIYGNQIGATLPKAGLTSCGAQGSQLEAAYTVASRYNLAGQVTGTLAPDPDGNGVLRLLATRNTYNARGLVEKVETGELAVWADETIAPAQWDSYGFAIYLTKEFTYDVYGRASTEATRGADDTLETLTQFGYDDHSRIRCRAARMNKAAFGSLPASACDLGAEGPDGPDRIARFTYDDRDQVLTEERAVGTPIAQTYMTNTWGGRGILGSKTDANGNRTEFRYDGLVRLARRVYPMPNAPGSVNEADYNEITYDNHGNVLTERMRNGAVVTYTNDNNNRRIAKDLSDNTYGQDVVYDFDLRGLSLSSLFGSDTGDGVRNTFDGFGRPLTSTLTMGGTSRTLRYQHDANGNRTRVTHPDNYFFEYGFDGLDRPNRLSESTAPNPTATVASLLTVGYRPSGGRVSLTRSGAGTTTLGLDNALRLSDFVQNFSGTANDLTNTFGYNPAGQVKWIDQSNPQYTYAEAQSLTGTYVPNGLNQYTSIGGQLITYDANGNLTGDGTLSYTYDMENRLVGTTGGVVSSFTYDPLGRLYQTVIAGTTRRFLYDGSALVSEYDGANVLVRRYVHGGQDDELWVQYNGSSLAASLRRFLYADHQGSIIAQTDGSGVVVAALAYDGFGIPATTNVGRFGFTGQAWLKELGLFHYKARMYSPRLGRFLQTDPVGYQDDLNLYAYVYNDPLNRTDPSGLGAVNDFLHGMGRGAYDADSEYSGITSEEFDQSLDDAGVDRQSFWFDVGHAVGNASMRPPDELSTGGSSRASVGIHGNDHRARRPQHGYVVRDTWVKNPKGQTDIVKVGTSGTKLNKDGTSPRANEQRNRWNREPGNQDRYKTQVQTKDMASRGIALQDEQKRTDKAQADGNSLSRHERPAPCVKTDKDSKC